jgi:CBS domain-containing protein
MLRLRDIMTTDVLSVTPQTSIREAMELLTRRHVSGAPVLAGGKIVGVVTGNDLMMLASSLSGVPTQRDLDDAFSDGESRTTRADADRERECSGAFFSDLWDDAGVDASERMQYAASPEWNALEEHDVGEVMTRTPLVTLGPDADVSTAATLMGELRIHRILVTENDHLVGIVSALDVVAAAGRQQLMHDPYILNHDAF